MIDEAYITKLKKYYPEYMRRVVKDLPFEAIRLPVGRRPDSTRELHQLVASFQRLEKKAEGKGWCIEWEDWASRKLGQQSWPVKITVESEEDFLYLIQKEEEIIAFKATLATMLKWRNGNLRSWLHVKPQRVLDLKEVWPSMQLVIDFLLQSELKLHYLRSLPVPVHTKFIEQNESVLLSIIQHLCPDKIPAAAKNISEALGMQMKPVFFTIRWLDSELAEQYSNGMELLKVTADALRKVNWQVKTVCVVENETNLYLLPQTKNMLVIEARGKALTLLHSIPFFINSRLLYWGDLDDEGFHMLSSFCTMYKNARSLLMDKETVLFHYNEMHTQPVVYRSPAPVLSDPMEEEAYCLLRDKNGRIEQEKLQLAYLQHRLNEIPEL